MKNFINNLYIFCKNYKIRDYEKDLISINYRIRNFSLIIEDFSKIIGNELQRKFIDSCEFFTEINIKKSKIPFNLLKKVIIKNKNLIKYNFENYNLE